MISLKTKIEEMGINLDEIEGLAAGRLVGMVGAVALATRDRWVQLAGARLKSGREEYINGLRKKESLSITEIGETVVFEIGLIGKMPNNFEHGMPSFDMKAVRPGWLGGKKAKTSKAGKKYVVIPFRHSTGSSARLAYTGKAAAADLQTDLKYLTAEWGLNRLVKTATGQPAVGVVAKGPRRIPMKGLVAKMFPDAKTHPLSGMVRIQQGPRGQGQLMTFRVMSENSDPGSWIHPGLKGVHLLPEVEAWANTELENAIRVVMGKKT